MRQTDKFLSKHNYDVINDDNHASIYFVHRDYGQDRKMEEINLIFFYIEI